MAPLIGATGSPGLEYLAAADCTASTPQGLQLRGSRGKLRLVKSVVISKLFLTV
jgi:hypothetical protein